MTGARKEYLTNIINELYSKGMLHSSEYKFPRVIEMYLESIKLRGDSGLGNALGLSTLGISPNDTVMARLGQEMDLFVEERKKQHGQHYFSLEILVALGNAMKQKKR